MYLIFAFYLPPQYLRVWWYLLHVAMEDPSVSKAGFIVLSNAKEFTLHIFKTKLGSGVVLSEKIFPIRWRMWHSCHMGAKLYPIVKRALRALMSTFQLETLFFHHGTYEKVVEELSKYSFSRRCIPEDLGECTFAGSVCCIITASYIILNLELVLVYDTLERRRKS